MCARVCRCWARWRVHSQGFPGSCVSNLAQDPVLRFIAEEAAEPSEPAKEDEGRFWFYSGCGAVSGMCAQQVGCREQLLRAS